MLKIITVITFEFLTLGEFFMIMGINIKIVLDCTLPQFFKSCLERDGTFFC